MSNNFRLPPATSSFREMEDIVLIDPDEEVSEKLTRKVFRPMLVENPHDADASVRGLLLYQRRKSKKQAWEDTHAINLSTLKGGEGVKFPLKAGELRVLYSELQKLYARPIGNKPATSEVDYVLVPADDQLVLSPRARNVVRRLVTDGMEELWDFIDELEPDFAETVLLRRQHESRQAALDEFERHFELEDWNEPKWQAFFEAHTWIFGHNLSYQFVSTLANQGYLGGTTFRGTGGSKADMLLHTEGSSRFVVIVDIKRPSTQLLYPRPYRNNAYRVSDEVGGGVAQVQSYCRTWVLNSSHDEGTRDELDELGIETYQPKGILVVGNLAQLENRQERKSFELYRRHLWTPEIITFDELLERARFTLRLESEEIA